jgi:hypothetical protein
MEPGFRFVSIDAAGPLHASVAHVCRTDGVTSGGVLSLRNASFRPLRFVTGLLDLLIF